MKAALKRYKTVIILTAVLLSLVGISYGAWTDALHIRGMVTTSSFGIEFRDTNNIKVGLVKRDDGNKIIPLSKDVELNITENSHKDVSLSIELDGELMDDLSVFGHMLCVEYPIKTSDNSKVKAINSEEANFSKPYTVITAIPRHIEIVVNDEVFPVSEEINKNDYRMDFNVYRQITTDDEGKTTAALFIEGKNIGEYSSMELGSIEYSSLGDFETCTDIDLENPVISAQLRAEYSLEVSIPAEQFNAVDTADIEGGTL